MASSYSYREVSESKLDCYTKISCTCVLLFRRFALLPVTDASSECNERYSLSRRGPAESKAHVRPVPMTCVNVVVSFIGETLLIRLFLEA